jgi:hypothetical protein
MGAPFADVVAPFVLYKRRHARYGSDNEAVDIFEELMKCGLLKPAVVETFQEGNAANRAAVGTAILAELCAGWMSTTPIDGSPSTGSLCAQDVDWLKTSRVYDDIQYVRANQRDSPAADIIASVPRIRFVFLFGDMGIILKYGSHDLLALEYYHVDAEGRVVEEMLNPEEHFRFSALREACRERVRENVEIRFMHQPS